MTDYSKSGKLLQNQNLAPIVTNNMVKAVSQYRRGVLEDEVHQGIYREAWTNTGTSPQSQKTALGNVTYSKLPLYKTATESTMSGGYRGSNNTVRQVPEIYSPLLLDSNLNLPRDRATINAWCRSFFALNPVVQNAISLHSTYPISKLNIKCKNEKVQKFFENMIEEIDLMNICVQIAQEYWTLGEAFVYAELDDRTAKWNRLLIQNPDYISVRHSVIAGEPIISLRPDENLKKIVTSNKAIDIQQRQKLNKSIVEHVKRGENIPLSNFYISHIARRIAPYEIRGTGLPVSCFRQLMLFDRLRESKFAQANGMINPLTLVKIGGGTGELKATPEDLEAYRNVFECHDEETEVLTSDGFKKYQEVIDYAPIIGTNQFEASPKRGIKIACFDSQTEEMKFLEPTQAFVNNYSGDMYHFKTNEIDLKVTPNHKLYVSKKKNTWEKIEAQNLKLTNYTRFRSQVKWTGQSLEFVDILGHSVSIESYLKSLGSSLSNYLASKIEQTNDKRIPRWVLNLDQKLLKILLDALVNGSTIYTTSKHLADDIYELVYKCGCVPNMSVKDNENYTIEWSISNKVDFPQISSSLLSIEKYTGKVWCFTVPTGLFITRRNGKITIQGNSGQYDKDFKIFTHDAVTVEKIGSASGIYDISGDITQLIKEIYIGLMVPQVLMDGGADTTYANGGVALDVLRQRYMQFRNMLSIWLRRKIFAPISKINDFYDRVDGEKILIVPDIDWNHMSLFDAGDYIQNLIQLTQEPKRVSLQTLYRSLGLDWEDENRKLKTEQIQETILLKEKDTLGRMSLADLRSLGSDDEIQEITESPVPGESLPGGPSEGSTPGGPPGGLPGSLVPPPPPGGPPPPPSK